jgi:hypothetical protein
MAGEIPARLAVAGDQVQDALRRADSKATTLLSLVGAAMAGVIALGNGGVSGPGAVLLRLALVPIFASVVLLLVTIWPRLNRCPVSGTWLYAAQVGPATLLESYGENDPVATASHVCTLARIARTKYRRIGQAVALLGCGLALLVVSLLVEAVA